MLHLLLQYVTWKKRPFGTLTGGPDSAPTGVSSELDFSRSDDEAAPASPSIPSGPGPSSPPRPNRTLRNRRQRRSDEHGASGSASPTTPSSESTGSWSPATGHSSAGPGPSPLREQFSPSIRTDYPVSQQSSPTRQHTSPVRQHTSPIRQQHTHIAQLQRYRPGLQHTTTQTHYSSIDHLQRHGRFHPYQMMTSRASMTSPQLPVPPGVPWSGASVAQGESPSFNSYRFFMWALAEVGPHPAPVVNMSPGYNHGEPVSDDAQQQWTESALGLDAYGATAALGSSSSFFHSTSYPSTTQEQASYTSAYIPQQILPHLQNIPDPSPDHAPYAEQSPTQQSTPHSYSYGIEGQSGHMSYEGTTAPYPQQAWNMPFLHALSVAEESIVAGSSQWAPSQWSESDVAPHAGTFHGHMRPASNANFQGTGFRSTHPSDNTYPPALPAAQRFSGAALSTQEGLMQHGVRPLTPSGHDHRQCPRHTKMSP